MNHNLEAKIEWKTDKLKNISAFAKIDNNSLVFLSYSDYSTNYCVSDFFLQWWNIEQKKVEYTRTLLNFDETEYVHFKESICFYAEEADLVYVFIDICNKEDYIYKNTLFLILKNTTKSIIARGSFDKKSYKLDKFSCQKSGVFIFGKNTSLIAKIDFLGNFKSYSIDLDIVLEELIIVDEELDCLFGFIKISDSLNLLKFNLKTREKVFLNLGYFNDTYLLNDYVVDMNKYHYNFKYKLIVFYDENKEKIIIFDSIKLQIIKTIPIPTIPKKFEEYDFSFLNVYFSDCNELLLITCCVFGPDAYYPSFGYSITDFQEIDFDTELCYAIKVNKELILTFGCGSCFHEGTIAYRKISDSKMKIQFVCLANSYKEGGRCIAGIVLENGNPAMQNGKPKWIRPVCETAHGEVPTHLVSHINLLDIVEIDVKSNEPDSYQSENVLFDTNSITVKGTFPINNLGNLCDNSQTMLFGNKGGAVTPENAALLSTSLRMIKVVNFNVVEKKYEDNPNPKLRLSFTFSGISYEIPITDPAFLSAYKLNKDLISNSSDVFSVISLGVLHQNWHSKLVAGIFYS